MQRHFDAHADTSRAQLQRLAENKEPQTGEEENIRRDLEALTSWERAASNLPQKVGLAILK